MKVAVLLLLLSALAAGLAVAPSAGEEKPPVAPCSCIAAQTTNGWCDLHAAGYVASIRIPSRMLYDTLDAHGHEVDLTTFDCPVCKRAIQTDGMCDQHNIGFVNRLAYFTRLAWEMARAVSLEPEGIDCAVCRSNAAASGWCAKHGVGMVGAFAIKDEPSWQMAAKLAGVLRIAVKKLEQCERCAMAIVYDSDCPVHRIYYKDGAPVPAPQAPQTPPQ